MEPFIRIAHRLGQGRQAPLTTTADIEAALHAPEPAWVHLDAADPAAARWIEAHFSYLDPHVAPALTAQETRPRAEVMSDGLLVILRGVNTNPGADPDDMVSVRLWLDPQRAVSVGLRQLASIADIDAALGEGRGPETAGAFLALLVERLGARIEDFLGRLADEVDRLEDAAFDDPDPGLSDPIAEARRQCVTVRRYVAPQKAALAAITAHPPGWMEEPDLRRVSEAADRLTRAVEDLDAMRERLQLARDALSHAQNERLNRNLYLLSIISAVFLPLGFLTGLMGVNLGGIPGAQDGGAFWVFAGGLVLIVALQILILRWLRWF